MLSRELAQLLAVPLACCPGTLRLWLSGPPTTTHRLTCTNRVPRSCLNLHCYAEEMNSEFARWDLSKHHYDTKWSVPYPEAPPAPPAPFPQYAFPEEPFPQLADGFGQLQLGRVHKTRTTPVVTRSRITRHGSQPNPVRPSSSGGEPNLIASRPIGPQRRSESYSHPTPLEDFRKSRRWPPSGFRQDDALKPQEAEDLICAGASSFKGYWDAIPNAPAGYDRFYAVMESEHQSRTDRASFQQQAYKDISLNMTGACDSQFPWLSQEQPCMAYAFGKSAGTTTLNYWIGKSGCSNPPTKVASDLKPRKIKLLQILDRLQVLESGLNEDVSTQPCSCQRHIWFTQPNGRLTGPRGDVPILV